MAAAPHEWFDGFGDLGTWLGSLGTVAAFGVGFYQIHRERKHRLLREMTDRIRLRRAHVDQVSAWIVDSELVVANHSGHPVHDVSVALDGAAANAGDRAGPPPHPLGSYTDRPTRVNSEPLDIGFVVPGEQRFPTPHPPEVTLVPSLTFTDVRGDRWHRRPGAPPVLIDAGDHISDTADDGDPGAPTA